VRSLAEVWKQTPSAVIRNFRAHTVSRPPTALRSDANGPLISLVRQIFCPGTSAQRTHVLFASADAATDITALCKQIGTVLSEISGAHVAVVEPQSASGSELDERKGRRNMTGAGSWGTRPSPLNEQVWRLPSTAFYDTSKSHRVDQGHFEAAFEFFVVAASASDGEASMLSSLCDGAVLVIGANRTRREAALRAKEQLLRYRAPLLGAVLEGRIFPIPEAIYQRL
jgi:hypothetical protein